MAKGGLRASTRGAERLLWLTVLELKL